MPFTYITRLGEKVKRSESSLIPLGGKTGWGKFSAQECSLGIAVDAAGKLQDASSPVIASEGAVMKKLKRGTAACLRLSGYDSPAASS
jgi:hypothetical protein